MKFNLTFEARNQEEIPSVLRKIAEEVPEDFGPVGIRQGTWLLLAGDGKQR